MVVVPTHWYSDSEQEEPQTEPKAQQLAVPFIGFTMQYVSSAQHEEAPTEPMSRPGRSSVLI